MFVSIFLTALLMGDEPASWVVAGDQVVITLTGVDIAKIRWEICRKEKYIRSSICWCMHMCSNESFVTLCAAFP